jgi:hypothetical protein
MNERRAHRSMSCWCGHGGSAHYGAGEESAAVACRDCERPSIHDGPELPMLIEDRRRFERFGLSHPVRTSVGKSPAYVIDASIAGLRVMHHDPVPPVGDSCRLMFHSDFGSITLECEIVRTSTDRNGGAFQTGMRIVAADHESEGRLRALVMALALPSAPKGH